MTPLENVEVIFSLISQGISPEFDGRMTVAFLPTMNVVSGMLQDGELTHDQAIKVSFSIVFCHPLNNTLNEDWKRIYQQLVRGHHALKTLRSMHLEHVVFALPNIHAVKKQNRHNTPLKRLLHVCRRANSQSSRSGICDRGSIMLPQSHIIYNQTLVIN